MKSGKVYLVGAGPGDPGLLTLKGRDLIEAGDCIIYDYLVNPEILSHAAPRAELINVGKRGTEHQWTQSEINRLLIDKAREYARVVRLKGGDPFIFGRGGEEATALAAAGIDWEVVPGVTAGSAVPAYAGIPVTHRGLSSSVAFVTGHEDPQKESSAIRWEHLSRGVETLVIFMGVGRLAEITAELISHGRDAAEPAAIIRWGTYGDQQVWTSTLGEVGELARRESVTSPAIIIIGEVVRLRKDLAWFAPELVERSAASAA